MIVYTVSQLLEMSEGTVPEAFRAKIKKVFAANSGDKGGKPWKLQKIIVTDGAKEIEIMLSDRDDISRTAEGSQIFAAASRGERGLSGLKRKDNVFKEKTTIQVWIYDSAEMSLEGATNGTASTQQTTQSTQTAPATKTTAPATNENGHAAQGNGNGNGHQPPQTGGIADKRTLRANAMRDFDKRIARTSAALNRCFDASFKLIADVNSRHGKVLMIQPTGELIEKIAMGLMVNACWGQKPADVEAFPMKTFQAIEEEDARSREQAPVPTETQRNGQPFN